MEEKGKQQRDICEECKKNPSKYKCPGCDLRSCSLPCVNSHKIRIHCTGKRPVTNFVPISQFDDNLLLSDYNMLEDVKRIAESARRTRIKLCGYSNFEFRPKGPLKSLWRAAASRGTKILFQPNGMSKRDTNKTYYKYRGRFISWTIEWRFHSADVVLVDHGVNENTTLSSVIEKHLKPSPWNHPLRQFCDQNLDSLKFFIRKYPKGSKALFRQLNIKAPIREQLADTTILEYPSIHVFLPADTCHFEVINDPTPNKAYINNPPHHDYPSPKGKTFKEEEIEDGESQESRVLDLVNYTDKQRESDRESKDSEEIPLVKRVKRSGSFSNSEDNNIRTKSCIEQLVAIGDEDFDFGTDFDSFLDFEGILGDVKDLEEGEFLVDDELEEGEIVA